MWPVSEARQRDSPRPQDPVRLTPHEAQDKHTKHPAPRGPRRGGPCRRPPPYTSAPSAAASLAASFPRFCKRPAGGAGAEEKGRRDRRKAGQPEPALRGRRPPRGRLKPSGSPRPRSSGPPASVAPPAPGAASANAGQSPRRVGNTLRSPLRPESACCFPEGSGAKARGRRDPPQPHLHAAVQLLPRQAAPRRLLQRLRRQPHGALQALQHLPLVGIRGLA